MAVLLVRLFLRAALAAGLGVWAWRMDRAGE